MLSGESPVFCVYVSSLCKACNWWPDCKTLLTCVDCCIILIFSDSYWVLALWVPCFLVVTLYRIYLFICRCLEDPPLLVDLCSALFYEELTCHLILFSALQL